MLLVQCLTKISRQVFAKSIRSHAIKSFVETMYGDSACIFMERTLERFSTTQLLEPHCFVTHLGLRTQHAACAARRRSTCSKTSGCRRLAVEDVHSIGVMMVKRLLTFSASALQKKLAHLGFHASNLMTSWKFGVDFSERGCRKNHEHVVE